MMKKKKRPVSITGRQQFSDQQPTMFGILKDPDKGASLFSSNSQLRQDDFVWGWEINGQPIPTLPSGWAEVVRDACPFVISAEQQKRLQDLVTTYLWERFALTTGTRHREITKKLERMKKAATQLLEAVEIFDHGDVLTWRLLEANPHQPLIRDSFYPVLTSFVARVNLVVGQTHAERERTQGTLHQTQVWQKYVRGIVEFFRAHDWEVKISKPKGGETAVTPHPSSFVNFVWALMELMPAELRNHFSNRWAMADALNSVRSTMRKAKSPRAPKK
jgi:hypothetical protein